LQLRLIISVMGLLLTAANASASVAGLKPADDPSLLLSPRIEKADLEKRKSVGAALLEHGDSLSSQGNYSEAATYYRKAIKVWPENDTAKLVLAKCIDKQGHAKEALFLVNRILAARLGTDALRTKISIQTELGQYDDALRSCDLFERWFDLDGESPTLKSAVYLAAGQKSKAVESAKEAYFHCIRNNLPSELAVIQLKSLGVEIPDSVPFDTSDNEAVLNNVQILSERSHVPTKEDVEEIFKVGFYPLTITDHHHVSGWCSVTHEPRYFRTVVLQESQNVEPYEELRVLLNCDRCHILKSELERKFGTLETSMGYPAGVSASKIKSAKNNLIFFFNLNSETLNGYALRMPIEKKIVKSSPNKTESVTIEKIQTDLKQKKFRVAANEILRHWEELLQGDNEKSGYEKYISTKQCLIQAYEGMHNQDIVQYLKIVPWILLRADIDKSPAHPELPTLAEFLSHKWSIGGCVSNEDSGVYLVYVEGYPNFPITPSSRFFKQLYRLVGPANEPAKSISPLPAEWIDAESFQMK
jgi:tetratricopeptide (TPR) repeat protein